ncbi:hypothetical protein ACFCP7_10365 [Paenibacillus elgii]
MKKNFFVAAIITIIASVSILGVVNASSGNTRGHYWGDFFDSELCLKDGGQYMRGNSSIIADWGRPKSTFEKQATAGVELWKNGYFVDKHSKTNSGTGSVQAVDWLDACKHPASEKYRFIATQNVWYPDSEENKQAGLFQEHTYTN